MSSGIRGKAFACAGCGRAGYRRHTCPFCKEAYAAAKLQAGGKAQPSIQLMNTIRYPWILYGVPVNGEVEERRFVNEAEVAEFFMGRLGLEPRFEKNDPMQTLYMSYLDHSRIVGDEGTIVWLLRKEEPYTIEPIQPRARGMNPLALRVMHGRRTRQIEPEYEGELSPA